MPIDEALLRRAIEAAFVDTGFRLGREFRKAITDPIYDWPRGESPRDIVDTGALRARQVSEFRGWVDENTLRFEYSWPVSYAAAVHQGAVYRDETRMPMPARPWTRVALGRFDANRYFQRVFKRYLANGGVVE